MALSFYCMCLFNKMLKKCLFRAYPTSFPSFVVILLNHDAILLGKEKRRKFQSVFVAVS